MNDSEEVQLKNFVIQKLSNDFDIQQEVAGIHPVYGKVRIDLLLTPKQQTIEKGADFGSFGIEIKNPKTTGCSVKKMLDCLVQAYSYTISRFNGVIPDFVLVFPSFDKFYDENHCHQPNNEELKTLRRFLQRLNVGELKFEKNAYSFWFTGQRLWHSGRGRSKQKGLGLCRRYGTNKHSEIRGSLL